MSLWSWFEDLFEQSTPVPKAVKPAPKAAVVVEKPPVQKAALVVPGNTSTAWQPSKTPAVWTGGPTPFAAAPAAPAPVNTANRVNTALLRGMGWQTPNAIPRAEVPEDWLDMGAAKDISGFEYEVAPDELNILRNAYGQAEGFTPATYSTNGPQKVRSDITRAAPLTWEAYNKLSEPQRRAVDFNTLFLQAREKDLTDTDADERDGAYDQKVENIFGKAGSSDTYAPNTVDLLERIGFQAKGQDLDEFLSLDRLVSADELEAFVPPTEPVVQWELDPRAATTYGENKYAQTRGTANQLAVDALAIEQAGAFIDEAMKDPGTWDFTSSIQKALTGEAPTGMDIPWGFGVDADRVDVDGNLLQDNAGKDDYFNQIYTALRTPSETMGTVWSMVNSAGMDEADIQQLYNFFDLRTKKDIASGFVDPDLRSAQDIRKLTGLEG